MECDSNYGRQLEKRGATGICAVEEREIKGRGKSIILSVIALLFFASAVWAGDMKLRWDYTQDGTGVTFELQRSPVATTPQGDPAGPPGEWVTVNNAIKITSRTYTDKAAPEGGWYYRMRALGTAGTSSEWSNYTFGISKRKGPDGLGITVIP